MPSRADRQLVFERIVRWAAMLFLAVALWRLISAATADSERLYRADLSSGVTELTRDSLSAVQRSGTRVEWSGELAAVAAMAEPTREPQGGWRVSFVAEGGSFIADSLGVIDSLEAGSGSITTPGSRGGLFVREGFTESRAAPYHSADVRRVAVFGRAGWESKFVIAALEEAGWQVDARIRVGPAIDVTQGGAARQVSIARHSAVVVLDTVIGRDAASIIRFVRDGGGLILAGEGTAAPALRAIAPGVVHEVEPPEMRRFEDHDPTHSLPLYSLSSSKDDVVLLEDREGSSAILVRRERAGRVMQMGYSDTWRWRMEAEGRSVEAHRAFWSRLVGAVAAATYEELPTLSTVHENGAPLARVVHALGYPTEGSDVLPTFAGNPLPLWLGILIAALLLAEWWSRRTRGES